MSNFYSYICNFKIFQGDTRKPSVATVGVEDDGEGEDRANPALFKRCLPPALLYAIDVFYSLFYFSCFISFEMYPYNKNQ